MHMVNAAVLEGWSVLSDEVVVQRVLEGHVALFEVLMRRHNERLYRAARAIVRDETEAEDVMQQAYVNAYANLRQFDGRAAFATWLTRIAVNEAISRARRRGRYEPFDGQDPAFDKVVFANRSLGEGGPTSTANNPERQAFTREMRVILESAIDTLPDGQREVFMLREVEELSTAETANSLGVSEDVVKTRLSRSRAALRRDLVDRIGPVAADSFTFLRPRCDRIVAAVLARVG
jgi:RNA polymerase sigma-70 factor, ECF subfamily